MAAELYSNSRRNGKFALEVWLDVLGFTRSIESLRGIDSRSLACVIFRRDCAASKGVGVEVNSVKLGSVGSKSVSKASPYWARNWLSVSNSPD